MLFFTCLEKDMITSIIHACLKPLCDRQYYCTVTLIRIILYDYLLLRLPHRNDAKIAKICNFWTVWPVIQLINHLFKIEQKAFLPNTIFVGFQKDGLLAEFFYNLVIVCNFDQGPR